MPKRTKKAVDDEEKIQKIKEEREELYKDCDINKNCKKITNQTHLINKLYNNVKK